MLGVALPGRMSCCCPGLRIGRFGGISRLRRCRKSPWPALCSMRWLRPVGRFRFLFWRRGSMFAGPCWTCYSRCWLWMARLSGSRAAGWVPVFRGCMTVNGMSGWRRRVRLSRKQCLRMSRPRNAGCVSCLSSWMTRTRRIVEYAITALAAGSLPRWGTRRRNWLRVV